MDLVSQNLLLSSGGKKDSTYVDDVFSTYLWFGNETARTIPTGVDNTEGALAWVKSRNDTHQHHLVDTERGSNKVIYSDSHIAESTIANRITGFTNNGFNLGSAGQVNGTNAYKYAGWNFRKAEGFFDIVTWTGNATNSSSPPRQIAHNLGSVPGAIWVKCLTANQSWACYHRSLGATRYMHLSDSGAGGTSAAWWNDTEPTSTHFTVKHDGQVNENNQQYVAYVFAGGESTAATARSLTFDGSYDSLQLASSSDFNFGTGDFTFEGWLKPNNNTDFQVFLNWGSDNPSIAISNDSNSYIYYNSTVNTKIAGIAAVGEWTHYAISRSSGTTRLFLNGELKNSFSDSHNYGAQALSIGAYINGNNSWNGSISNVRIVKGTAVYTESFRPPTEPLTNITNTKLLCCNNSSTTGSTVTPGTITAENNVTASTDSPFDDPEGFKFGEGGDQNIVKCGSFLGNGSATGPEINLGWEPQWVLTKNSGINDEWYIFDSMRGIVTGGDDPRLRPNSSGSEATGDQRLDLTSTGFKITSNNGDINGNGNRIIYIALRRPDGYVGKPAEAGTDVFAMDIANGSTDGPTYDSGFPVDFLMRRKPTGGNDDGSGGLNAMFIAYERLIGLNYLRTTGNDAQATSSRAKWDLMTGANHTDASPFQAWMWKRHAGFDVQAYKGRSVNTARLHGLGKVPEMMWVKRRDASSNWAVYHKDLHQYPQDYYLILNDSLAAVNASQWWKPPTSTHWFTAIGGLNNVNNANYIAMLFASVAGISKVGSYSGSSYDVTINLGFTPRFLVIKAYNSSSGNQRWTVFDSLRGMGAGSNDNRMYLDSTQDQQTGDYINSVSSTGITMKTNYTYTNSNGNQYIYYAHA